MEFECENLTTLGCERMDSVKELMLLEQIESNEELDLNRICKNQCCKDCDNLKHVAELVGMIQQKNLKKKK